MEGKNQVNNTFHNSLRKHKLSSGNSTHYLIHFQDIKKSKEKYEKMEELTMLIAQ